MNIFEQLITGQIEDQELLADIEANRDTDTDTDTENYPFESGISVGDYYTDQ